MSLIRLVTVHPVLVHLTLGLIPLMVLAYLLATLLGSARWAFVADVALYGAAVVTIATVAFGLVSYLELPWPGGLSPWSALHLAFGVTTAVALLSFSGYRIGNRRQRPNGGWPAVASSLVVAAFATFTGWIGGELLVYHAGMGVRAAGNGALAPTTRVPDLARPPHPSGMEDAMADLRGNWAAIETANAHMLVEHPDDATFDQIAHRATRISQLAAWVAQHAAAHEHPPAPGGQPSATAPASPASHAAVEPPPAAPAEQPDEHRRAAELAGELQRRADELGAAASAHDIIRVTADVGRVAETCATCHHETRWKLGS
jgi:uncharacterized membrane protein